MRLSESEIIAGLNHPNVFVRDVVLNYLEDSFRTQAVVTSRVIEAVERFGWEEAFLWPHRIGTFQPDPQNLAWVLSEIERTDEAGPQDNMRWHLARGVAMTPVEVLRPELPRIMELDVFHDAPKSMHSTKRTLGETIGLRVELAEESAAECWRKLHRHCEEISEVEIFVDADIPYAELLVDRIAVSGQTFAAQVLELLQRDQDSSKGSEVWVTGLMIILAGRLRLEPALDALYNKFERDWDWYNEEIAAALRQIGTPAVGAMICQRYAEGSTCERIYSQGILEAVHYPTVIEDILPLLDIEVDYDYRAQLGVALASHFDEAGIAPALEVYEEWPEDPERLAIRQRLFAFSALAELDHPQQDQWYERIEADHQRFLKSREDADLNFLDLFKRVAERRLNQGWDSGEDSVPFESVPEEAWAAKPEPIVQTAPKIGRNELCPCGSGKKYKRCCLRTEQS